MHFTGLAGLTVAFVLAEAGHSVRVIEKRGLGVPAGGIRVPPNVSKLLEQWVPREELLRISTICAGTPFRSREFFLFQMLFSAPLRTLRTRSVGHEILSVVVEWLPSFTRVRSALDLRVHICLRPNQSIAQ